MSSDRDIAFPVLGPRDLAALTARGRVRADWNRALHRHMNTERWQDAGRGPFLLETSLPGVFAAGDVRSGSAKRVAAAVGEGAMAVSFVHAHISRPV